MTTETTSPTLHERLNMAVTDALGRENIVGHVAFGWMHSDSITAIEAAIRAEAQAPLREELWKTLDILGKASDAYEALKAENAALRTAGTEMRHQTKIVRDRLWSLTGNYEATDAAIKAWDAATTPRAEETPMTSEEFAEILMHEFGGPTESESMYEMVIRLLRDKAAPSPDRDGWKAAEQEYTDEVSDEFIRADRDRAWQDGYAEGHREGLRTGAQNLRTLADSMTDPSPTDAAGEDMKLLADVRARVKGLERKVGNHGNVISELYNGRQSLNRRFGKLKKSTNSMAIAVFPRLAKIEDGLAALEQRADDARERLDTLGDVFADAEMVDQRFDAIERRHRKLRKRVHALRREAAHVDYVRTVEDRLAALEARTTPQPVAVTDEMAKVALSVWAPEAVSNPGLVALMQRAMQTALAKDGGK